MKRGPVRRLAWRWRVARQLNSASNTMGGTSTYVSTAVRSERLARWAITSQSHLRWNGRLVKHERRGRFDYRWLFRNGPQL